MTETHRRERSGRVNSTIGRIAAVALLQLFLTAPARADTVTGPVRVIDGDTFQFESGLKVRIYGIDTLEKNQKCAKDGACIPCGEQTRSIAVTLIAKAPITCALRGEKSYDREMASCTVDGKDYAETIIAAGWALAYRRYLPKSGKGHAYVTAEEKAKASRIGIWDTQFIPPGDWRNRKMRLECER